MYISIYRIDEYCLRSLSAQRCALQVFVHALAEYSLGPNGVLETVAHRSGLRMLCCTMLLVHVFTTKKDYKKLKSITQLKMLKT